MNTTQRKRREPTALTRSGLFSVVNRAPSPNLTQSYKTQLQLRIPSQVDTCAVACISSLDHHQAVYFFFPLGAALPFVAFDSVDATLDAREGAAEVALLPDADLTLSSALFCYAGKLELVRTSAK